MAQRKETGAHAQQEARYDGQDSEGIAVSSASHGTTLRLFFFF